MRGCDGAYFEDELCIQNFSKTLKKGGKLLVNTPSNLGGSDAHSDEDESFIEEHARIGYSKEDITDKIKRAGLDVESFPMHTENTGQYRGDSVLNIQYLWQEFQNCLFSYCLCIICLLCGFVLILMWLWCKYR